MYSTSFLKWATRKDALFGLPLSGRIIRFIASASSHRQPRIGDSCSQRLQNARACGAELWVGTIGIAVVINILGQPAVLVTMDVVHMVLYCIVMRLHLGGS